MQKASKAEGKMSELLVMLCQKPQLQVAAHKADITP